jgi:hypothetical protein
MNTALIDLPAATAARVTDDELVVELSDGRTISAPVAWFPRLAYGTPEEQAVLEVYDGFIHWPMLDEDIGVETLFFGVKSGESARSLQRWKDEMDRRRREGRLHEPWGEELPLPDWWEED